VALARCAEGQGRGGRGYSVQKAKLKATCGEIYALDRNGARVELFVDPTSGEIVATR
jgi:hypothetical protein